MDPLAPDYPWNSTYAFAENDVIRAADLEGAEKDIKHDDVFQGNVGEVLRTSSGFEDQPFDGIPSFESDGNRSAAQVSTRTVHPREFHIQTHYFRQQADPVNGNAYQRPVTVCNACNESKNRKLLSEFLGSMIVIPIPESQQGETWLDLAGNSRSKAEMILSNGLIIGTFLRIPTGSAGETIGQGPQIVSRSLLRPTHHVTKPKSQMKVLLDDIRKNGIKEPLPYVEHNGLKYLVGGHHRYFAAEKLGITNVPIQQVQLPYAGYRTTSDLIMARGKHPGYWKYLK